MIHLLKKALALFILLLPFFFALALAATAVFALFMLFMADWFIGLLISGALAIPSTIAFWDPISTWAHRQLND